MLIIYIYIQLLMWWITNQQIMGIEGRFQKDGSWVQMWLHPLGEEGL
jgi:hypothetical protein